MFNSTSVTVNIECYHENYEVYELCVNSWQPVMNNCTNFL